MPMSWITSAPDFTVAPWCSRSAGQSGLNVSDRWYAPGTPFAGADWAQMFAGKGATFLGKTPVRLRRRRFWPTRC